MPPAASTAYPYAARIVVDGLGSCSGTLIASRYVLTAGHCATEVTNGVAITDPSRFHVRVGNTRPASDPSGYLGVSQVLRHPAFDADRLLQRRHAAASGGTRRGADDRPAAAGEGRRCCAAGTMATIAGWGLIRQTPSEVLAPTLYAGRIRLMSDAACTREWRTDVDRPTMFCAGPVGTRTAETCSGDSGGPLLVVDPSDHRTYQAGSTSYGAEDCTASSSVFARLAGASIRSFLVTAAGLGPATVGPADGLRRRRPHGHGARDGEAARRRRVGLGRVRHALRALHARPCASAARRRRRSRSQVAGLTPGRSRNVRIVAWSSYGVRHSAPVRVDHHRHRRADRPSRWSAKGKRGQRIRLRFRPVENSLQVAALAEVMAGDRRSPASGRCAASATSRPAQTYFFSFRVPTGVRPTSWCVARLRPRRAPQRAPLRRHPADGDAGAGRPPPAPSAEPVAFPACPLPSGPTTPATSRSTAATWSSLAEEFGAPLWVISESTVRDNYRRLRDAFHRVYAGHRGAVRHEGQPAAGDHRGACSTRARSSTPSRSAT